MISDTGGGHEENRGMGGSGAGGGGSNGSSLAERFRNCSSEVVGGRGGVSVWYLDPHSLGKGLGRLVQSMHLVSTDLPDVGEQSLKRLQPLLDGRRLDREGLDFPKPVRNGMYRPLRRWQSCSSSPPAWPPMGSSVLEQVKEVFHRQLGGEGCIAILMRARRKRV